MVDSREQRLRVRAPARLHLGFLELSGRMPRAFASLGVTLEEIATEIEVRRAAAARIQGLEEERIRGLLARFRAAWGIPPVEVRVREAIPAHRGLGSGTQLALALGTALARLCGIDAPPRAIAKIAGRGARSGIGLGAFEQGGVLLDGGRGAEEEPPPIVARLPFPEHWRILLVFDPAREGLSGAAEGRAFAALPPLAEHLCGRLCRLTLLAFLPGVARADLTLAGPAIGEIQRIVGDHFASFQGGGRFASPRVAAAMGAIEQAGIAAVGQTSWGPTGFALLPDEDTGRRLLAALEPAFPDLTFHLLRGRNRGAEVASG